MENFEKIEQKIVRLTKSSLKKAYPVYWLGVEIILSVVKQLQKEVGEAKENDDFNIYKYDKVFLILIGKGIQNTESIRILLERGLYGDCFPLTRNVLSNISMMQYLHFHPELLDLFLSEGQKDFQNNIKFRRAFSEYAVETELVKQGIEPIRSAFEMLSKTAHASYFGSQLYWSKDHKNGTHHIKYGPKFEPEKAVLLSDIFSSIHYDFITIILWHRHHLKENIETPEWMTIRENLKELKKGVLEYSNSALAVVNLLWPNGTKVE